MRCSVNPSAHKTPEIGVDCGWQTARRDAPLMPVNFPMAIGSEVACGVDRKSCGLRSLPGFLSWDGWVFPSAPWSA